MNNDLMSIGEITMEIIHDDGTIEEITCKNNLLDGGRIAVLENLISTGGPSTFISKMVWGDGGVVSGKRRVVDSNRTGLFGTVRARRSVVSRRSDNKAYIISTLKREDAVGYTINEMGLELSDGTYYAMATFNGYYKSDTMQVNYTWRLNYL